MRLHLVLLILFFLFHEMPAFSQMEQTVNIELIKQRKLRKYISERKINYMNDFASIHPSWNENTDRSAFRVQERSFRLKDSIANVWDCYLKADPSKSWNGRFVRFGILISKITNSVVNFKTDTYPALDTGQVYFLDIKLLRGLFHVPMAFEIITVDKANRIVEFSYIDSNKELGKQTLEFIDTGKGETRIVHRSYFKSDSHIRDGLLYPYFHKKIIRDYHRNMRYLVMDRVQSKIMASSEPSR